jgi:hypothetical protein
VQDILLRESQKSLVETKKRKIDVQEAALARKRRPKAKDELVASDESELESVGSEG